MFLLILIDCREQTIVLVPAKCFRQTSTYFDVLSGFVAGILFRIKVFLVLLSHRNTNFKVATKKRENKKKTNFAWIFVFFIIYYCVSERMSGSIDPLSNDARHADSGETEREKKKIRRIKERRFTSRDLYIAHAD